MPHASHQARLPYALLALAVAVGLMFTLAQRAEAAPPVDELTWSHETCANGFPQATLTATGNGRWATVVVQVSTDGGATFYSAGEMYDPWRIEHDTPMTVGDFGDVIFRASDAKNNGALTGDWTHSEPIDCP